MSKLVRLGEEYRENRARGWNTPIDNADRYVAALEAALAERDHYLKKLQERNTQLQQAEAVASSSDTLLLEATQWAKDARERAEKAEAALAAGLAEETRQSPYAFDPHMDGLAAFEAALLHQKLLTEESEKHAEFETELNRKSLIRAEQAEAALAERDRMLRLAILDGDHPAGMDADYLADLRARAEDEPRQIIYHLTSETARVEYGGIQGHACPDCGQHLLYGAGHLNCPGRAEEGEA